jgi:hypothetical protein
MTIWGENQKRTPEDARAKKTPNMKVTRSAESNALQQTQAMKEGGSSSTLNKTKTLRLQGEQVLNRPAMASWQVDDNHRNI